MFKAIIIAIAAAYIVCAIRTAIADIRNDEAEEEAFEQKRKERRMHVIERDKETARMELIDAWAKVGRMGYYDAD